VESGTGVVDPAPRDFVLSVEMPAVRGADAGDQVQTQAAVGGVAADGEGRRPVGRSR